MSVEIGSEFDSSGIDSAVSKLGNMKMAVAGAGAALGALAVGGMAKSVEAAASLEEAMTGVEKVTDPETAREMEGAIRDMAGEMPLAVEELAGITEQAGRLGVEGVENLESYTETVAQMATATDLTSEEAADSFARIGTLMDIPVEQSANLGSAMNELSNSMGTSASEITDVMTRAGGSLNALGVGKEQALALAGAMNEVSPSSRLAAGGMKRMAEAMMDPGNVAAFASALGVTEEEFKRMREEDPSGTLLRVAEATNQSEEAANTLKAELGKAGQEFQTLGQNTDSAREATETATKAWEENTSMQEEAETAASTFNARMQIAKNRIRDIGISIGQQLLPPLTTLLEHVITGVEWFGRLNEKTDGLLATFTLVAGALGGFIAAGAAAVSMLGGMAAVMTGLGAAFTVLTGPIGLAILLIAGLATVWQTNLFQIRDITKQVIGTVKDALTTVFDFLQNNVIQPFLDWILPIWRKHFSEIAAEVKKTAKVWMDAIRGFIDWAKPYVQEFLDIIQSAWDKWGDDIMGVVRPLMNGIKRLFELSFGAVKDIVVGVLSLLRGDVEGFKDAMGRIFQRAVDAVVGVFKWLKKRLVGNSIFPDMLSSILDAITNWDVVGAFKDAVNGALKKVKNFASDFKDAGKGLLSAFVGGVKEKISDAKGAAKDLAGKVRDHLPGSNADTGPLADLTAAGEALPETFAASMSDRMGAIKTASDSLAAKALPAADRRGGRERIVVERGSDEAVIQALNEFRTEMAGTSGDITLEVDGKELARASDDSRDRFIIGREINQ